MRPIGIFGGTFDPIHNGHLLPVDEVRRSLDLDSVRFILAARPGHRASPVADVDHRWRMLTLAIGDFPHFVADDRELRRGGISYTVPTLESLRQEVGSRSLCLILGLDAFLDLPTWHRWREVTCLAHVAVMQRPGWTPPVPLPEWWAAAVCPQGRDLGERSAGWIRLVTVTCPQRACANVSNAVRTLPRICLPPCTTTCVDTRSTVKQPRGATVQAEQMKATVMRAMDEAKAQDIRPLDVRGMTDITDFMIVAGGTSDRHVKTIAEKVLEVMREAGCKPVGVEGQQEGDWILIDYGDVVVHVMRKATREHYDLEGLWSEQLRDVVIAQREGRQETP